MHEYDRHGAASHGALGALYPGSGHGAQSPAELVRAEHKHHRMEEVGHLADATRRHVEAAREQGLAHTLAPLLVEVSHTLPAPSGKTLYDEWKVSRQTELGHYVHELRAK